MRNPVRKSMTVALLALAVGATGAVPATAGTAKSQSSTSVLQVVGITTDQKLVVFKENHPGRLGVIGKVRNLSGDTKIVGIDFRVQNRKLYGVGDKGGIYVLSTSSARATKVSQLSVPLQGTAYGVDFNPAANRLRIISDTGQNLRHNLDDEAGLPKAGTTAEDKPLTNPPVPPSTTSTTATAVSGAAYTNDDLSTDTNSTLFVIDTDSDQVHVQSPANAGTLAPVGKLKVDATVKAGFDVYSTVRDGVTTANTGYVTLKVNGVWRFYAVNLLTGKVFRAGAFPSRGQVVDIAVPLAQG